MIFPIKAHLPDATQKEIDRISAIPSGQRNATEVAFLTNLAPYLTNEILELDDNGLIMKAAGNTLPTSYEGFKKGALFIKKDAADNGSYNNVGNETSASWDLIDNATTANIADGAVTTDKLAATLDLTGKDVKMKVKEGTPVNAVAATRALTVSGVPSHGDTVTIGTHVYTLHAAIGAGSKANSTLTFTGNAANTQTVVIGDKTYTYKDALTEKAASGVLTAAANFSDADTVTLGTAVYKFTVNLSTPAIANEIKIGANASASLDNLIAAVNGAAGEGSTYSIGTVAHPDVSAAAGAGDTIDFTAKVKGVAGNSIATTEACSQASFAQGTLTTGADAVANEVKVGLNAEASLDNLLAAINGAAGAGTTYSTGTVAHTTVDATKDDAAHLSIDAKTAGDAGNAIATTETLANASFTGATLAGGEGVDAPDQVLIGVSAEATIDNLVLAINAGAGAGTNYGTGTVAHADVSAAKTAADTMTVTAKVKGEGGNGIALAKSGANLSWASASLTGGVNGTVGANGEVYKDATYLYVAKAANTTADQNWRRVDLGAAY